MSITQDCQIRSEAADVHTKNAFHEFAQNARQKLLKEQPNMSAIGITRVLMEEWSKNLRKESDEPDVETIIIDDDRDASLKRLPRIKRTAKKRRAESAVTIGNDDSSDKIVIDDSQEDMEDRAQQPSGDVVWISDVEMTDVVPVPSTEWVVENPHDKFRQPRQILPRHEVLIIEDDDIDDHDAGKDDDVIITGEDSTRVHPSEFIKSNVSTRLKSKPQIKLIRSDFCISCRKKNKRGVCHHPLFEGSLCEQCMIWFSDNVLTYDGDGRNRYCIICIDGGDLFVCESSGCPRVYCAACLKFFGVPVKNIREELTWHCFLCKPYSLQTHGILRPRSDWLQWLINFFRPQGMTQPLPSMRVCPEKRPLRVLSLFDGIGTGRIALQQLGLACEKYYGCEIDPDAILVTRIRLPDIHHLGDVTELTAEQITGLMPIDLMIGGSPCNEISLVNPRRQGLQGGSGLLFFEYCRILQTLQKCGNKGHHLFWLYENVYPMPIEIRETMCRFFESRPAMWDAEIFSAQRRRRYFWGNIPGLHVNPDDSSTVENAEFTKLEDVLMTSRKPIVRSVKTITTNANSLRWVTPNSEFSVRMDKSLDQMWLPEIEKLFGLEAHFTDVRDMCAVTRRRLLGKTWSIPVIKHLLGPLRHFFLTER